MWLLLSQSFTFLGKQTALARMTRQHGRMVNAGDVAVSQVDEIEQAMDDLGSDRIAMGVHHLSLVIRADTQKALTEHISDAGSALSDAGIKWAREDVGMAGAFWAQLGVESVRAMTRASTVLIQSLMSHSLVEGGLRTASGRMPL